MSKKRKKPGGRPVLPRPAPVDSRVEPREAAERPLPPLYLEEADPPPKRPWLLLVAALLLAAWNIVLLILAVTTAS